MCYFSKVIRTLVVFFVLQSQIRKERPRQSSVFFSWIPGRGFRLRGTGLRILYHWNLDSWIQSLVGSRFLELFSGFQSPGFQISQAKLSWISESGIWISESGIWIPFYGTSAGVGRLDCIQKQQKQLMLRFKISTHRLRPFVVSWK